MVACIVQSQGCEKTRSSYYMRCIIRLAWQFLCDPIKKKFDRKLLNMSARKKMNKFMVEQNLPLSNFKEEKVLRFQLNIDQGLRII